MPCCRQLQLGEREGGASRFVCMRLHVCVCVCVACVKMQGGETTRSGFWCVDRGDLGVCLCMSASLLLAASPPALTPPAPGACAGEVLLCLLSALHAAQHFAKLLTTLAPRHVSMGPWRAQGDSLAGVWWRLWCSTGGAVF